MTKENLYNLTFKGDNGRVCKMGVIAKNKVEAITKGMEKLTGWREKDSIQEIIVNENAGNKELTHLDYK